MTDETRTEKPLCCCVCGYQASAQEADAYRMPTFTGEPRLPFRHVASECWRLARDHIERLTQQRDASKSLADEHMRENYRLRAEVARLEGEVRSANAAVAAAIQRVSDSASAPRSEPK